MKKKLMSSMLILSLLAGVELMHYPALTIMAEESSSQMSEEEEHHDHDHDYEFEFDASAVVAKEGDAYILIHSDHYHKINASELSETQIKAADEHLADHPELAEEYEQKQNIYNGYFEDDQVEDRTLEDWTGEWQSVLPYLEDGTLKPVMEMKARKEGATMSAEEYTEYYQKGYVTDVDEIVIKDNQMSFTSGNTTVTGTYKYDGYQILTYEKGNRGIRYFFTKESGDESAPQSIQFSDHNISPTPDLTHYHIYMADMSHEELLEEMDNWSTFYPAGWNAGQILADQLNH
ncbi:ZinT/AdcA family metal-binding protein [Globicatella sulfidifaciens]|uniref:Zinc transport system substrate-binding protein n=1 Tax=Globicatella sulfidifaciens DSM 15739 TaxID=1121925 RepID=A0A1T4K3W2_9LACT|nr:ZinT/AdcA family metal-binding protein [Globicatella sulfidifaciens]SJZ37116.1 zinc transport system substrate-binding protein [Globicatella sulfidifaciens DSM 15739]